MKINELKQIIKLMRSGGIIDDINIKSSETGIKVEGVDPVKTFFTVLEYSTKIDKEIALSGIAGIEKTASKYIDSEAIIDGNKLKMGDGIIRGSEFILKEPFNLGINLPKLTDDDFDVIAMDVDHNVLKTLSSIRSENMSEEYTFYIVDNKLMMRAGLNNDNNSWHLVGECKKAPTGFTIKFTMNIQKCFANIFSNANIYIVKDKIMIVECIDENYVVRYHLAPRVDD